MIEAQIAQALVANSDAAIGLLESEDFDEMTYLALVEQEGRLIDELRAVWRRD